MDGLLARLAKYAGCEFISDLPNMAKTSLGEKLIDDIKTDDYSYVEWCDAACYITQKKQDFSSAENARAAIYSYLSN